MRARRIDITRPVVLVALLLLAAGLLQSDSHAQVPPFELHLPDGSVQQACGAQYTPDAKVFAFAPCLTIFADSFEESQP